MKKKKVIEPAGLTAKLTELPSDNAAMEEFILNNQPALLHNIMDNIDFAISNHWSVVEVFSFKKSNFVVVINRSDFKESLQYSFDFGMENQHYDLCAKSKRVMDKLDKMSFVRKYKIKPTNTNVKEKTTAKKSSKRPKRN